jgi:5-formyltetrahydrofolate cyclo-ligase
MFPLSLFTYLLTADCDNPKSAAVCCSFNPWFATISLAMIAFTAGKTVFTPTSHGSIKFGTN